VTPTRSSISNKAGTSTLTQSPLTQSPLTQSPFKEAAPAAKPAGGELVIKAGDKIKHKAFGRGLVIAIKESGGEKIITVHFDGTGLKNLQLKTAPIEKI
jgi:DNA helicase-2/ATP-dependent DNA helicase PcrA